MRITDKLFNELTAAVYDTMLGIENKKIKTLDQTTIAILTMIENEIRFRNDESPSEVFNEQSKLDWKCGHCIIYKVTNLLGYLKIEKNENYG